jgi:hypothetical protein
MRYRKQAFFFNATQYGIQKRFLVPSEVYNGVQIYKDTLHKKYCFFTDELGRVERGYTRLAQLRKDIDGYKPRGSVHYPRDVNYSNFVASGSSAS